MCKKTYLFTVFIIPALFLTLRGPQKVFAKASDATQGDGNYYDANILDNGSTPLSKKSNKKKKHRHRKKGSANKNNNGMNQNPKGPQEDVTEQRDVSEQADQSGFKNKK